jgi:hypothetical protein
MAGLRIDGGDDPVLGDPAGDPPGPGPLARLDVLAGHQRQQRHRLGLLSAQLQVSHRVEHGQRVVDQPRHQRLGGRRIIPGTHRLARPVVVVRGQPDLARPWHQPPHPADGGDQLGDGVLGGDRVARMVESSTRRRRPASTPVASTTWRMASKTRRGRSEARSRLR